MCLRSIMVSIPACHAGDPASIPGGGVFFVEMSVNNPTAVLSLGTGSSGMILP